MHSFTLSRSSLKKGFETIKTCFQVSSPVLGTNLLRIRLVCPQKGTSALKGPIHKKGANAVCCI